MPHCPHCGSPSLMNPCWYGLKHPGYTAGGADPPCAFDLYDIGQRELQRQERRGWGIALLLILAIIAVAIWWSMKN